MRFRLPFIAAVLIAMSTIALSAHAALTPDEVRQIAADAYVFGEPLVDNYRLYYAFAVRGSDSVSSTQATSIFNSPYRIAPLDLRAEPLVVGLPPVGAGRNWTIQLIDLYTRDFESLESVTVPQDGGYILVAGPNWNGANPEGCHGVLRARSELALAAVQIRLQETADLEAVDQAPPRLKTQSLSAYLGQAPPPPARAIDFLEPLSIAGETHDLEFFNQLAFLLRFCPQTPDDAATYQQLAKLGLLPGRPFGVVFMSPGEKAALTAGMAEGRRTLAATPAAKSFAEVFGTPSHLEAAAGADADPAINPRALSDAGAFEIPFTRDSGGHLLGGSQGRYTLTFGAGRLPPAASWSLALVSLPDQQPVANPIDRYFISSTMLPGMARRDDGSLTIFIQRNPPGGKQSANWLPAPNGPFLMILRFVGAEQPVLDNSWQRPRVQKRAGPPDR